MANQGYGLEFSRTLHGGKPVCKKFYIPSTDGTAVFKGDVVEIVNTTGAMDPLGEVPVCTIGVSGHILLGVVEGFEPDSSALVTGAHRAASTNRYVNVNIDPDSCYYAQQDDVGGTMTAASIGALTNANIIVAAGSTATEVSGTMVDSSTVTASAADLKVIGVRADKVNAGGVATCELEVMILAPAIKATDSQT